MRVLVTGSGGFVGRHLARELLAAGHEVVGFTHPSDHEPGTALLGDITDAARVAHVVREVRPEGCIHLAGIAFVPASWKDPQHTFAVNVGGTLNLLEALRAESPSCRLVVVSSAQIYGHHARAEPIRETDAADPDHPYAASKLSADLMTLLYGRHHGLHAMTARPCNHIGPGQPPHYVVPAFAAQVAAIAAGRAGAVMKVGNLDSEREFLDVRDVVRAYRLLLEHGRKAQAYNVASGRFVRIGTILDELCSLAGVRPRIEVDPALYRPTDVQPHLDTARIQEDTGWQPAIDLQRSLVDILNVFRA